MSGSYARIRAPVTQALAAGLASIRESIRHPGYNHGLYGLSPRQRDDATYMRAYARGYTARLIEERQARERPQ